MATCFSGSSGRDDNEWDCRVWVGGDEVFYFCVFFSPFQ